LNHVLVLELQRVCYAEARRWLIFNGLDKVQRTVLFVNTLTELMPEVQRTDLYLKFIPIFEHPLKT
jgi:hypothetical protein